MNETNWVEDMCKLVKKYGLGIILFVFFIWQYMSINAERKDVQKTFESTIRENVIVLIKMEDRLREIENLNKEYMSEINELRYEQRRLNDILGLPSKRYNKE